MFIDAAAFGCAFNTQHIRCLMVVVGWRPVLRLPRFRLPHLGAVGVNLQRSLLLKGAHFEKKIREGPAAKFLCGALSAVCQRRSGSA